MLMKHTARLGMYVDTTA